MKDYDKDALHIGESEVILLSIFKGEEMNTEDMEYIRDSFQDVHTALARIKSSIRRFSYVFGTVAGALVMHIYYDL